MVAPPDSCSESFPRAVFFEAEPDRMQGGREGGAAFLVYPGLARQVRMELPRINRCAGRASQRLAATALFEPGR